MLVLTDDATQIINGLVAQPGLPEGAGLRIAASGDRSQPLAVTTAAEPDAADQVIEEHGARVFLDLEAATLLDDKVLDAQVTDEGAVQFLLATQ